MGSLACNLRIAQIMQMLSSILVVLGEMLAGLDFAVGNEVKGFHETRENLAHDLSVLGEILVREIEACEDPVGHDIVKRGQDPTGTMRFQHGSEGVSNNERVDTPGSQGGLVLHGIVRTTAPQRPEVLHLVAAQGGGLAQHGLGVDAAAGRNAQAP